MPENSSYFCHVCETEVPVQKDTNSLTGETVYSCLHCHSDFVEEIEEEQQGRTEERGGGMDQPQTQLPPIFNMLSSLLSGANVHVSATAVGPDGRIISSFSSSSSNGTGHGGGARTTFTSSNTQTTNTSADTTTTTNTNTQSTTTSSSSSTNTRSTAASDRQERPHPANPSLHPLLASLLINEGDPQQPAGNNNNNPNPMMLGIAQLLAQSMGLDPLTGGNAAAGGQQHPLFQLFNLHGNPGDYAFGEHGLDDIITRLMEQQAAANAPPPAPSDVISGLPKIKIDKKQTTTSGDKKWECSICQDEFSEGSEATELPCKHVFHPQCIEYWLKINGSCPTCRYSLLKKEEEQGGGEGERSTSRPQASAPPPPPEDPFDYMYG